MKENVKKDINIYREKFLDELYQIEIKTVDYFNKVEDKLI